MKKVVFTLVFLIIGILLLTCRAQDPKNISVAVNPSIEPTAVYTTTPFPTVQPTKTPTTVPTKKVQPTPTTAPTQALPTPTTPYDPYQQFLIYNSNKESLNLVDLVGTTFKMNVFGMTRITGASFPNSALSENQLVGDCEIGPKLLISMMPYEDSVLNNVITIFGHSGACDNGTLFPFEPIREPMEGMVTRPDTNERETNLLSIENNPSKIICLSGVCFEIEMAKYFPKDTIDSYGGLYQTIYYEFDVKPEKQYVFIIFCGSDGYLKDQWFAGRYVLLLKTINPR